MGRRREIASAPLAAPRFVRLAEDVDRALERIAEAEDRPIGRVIRQLLLEALTARGEIRAPRR